MDEADGYGRTTARYYDAAYATLPGLGPDLAFYRELALETGGPALELGCGTGRALLPIAAEGIPCTGLDASPAMLAALRAKAGDRDIELFRAPMQDFDLGGARFSLVFAAFRGFQHLYTVDDQLRCLACVRRHLAPGGTFAFDVFNPRLDRIWGVEEPEEEDLRFELAGDEVVRTVRQRRDHALQLVHLVMRYERRSGGRIVGEESVEFRMRWFHRFELEHLMRRAGFERVEIFGDFEGGPVARDAPAFVVVAG